GVRFMPLKGLYIWGSGGYGSLNRDFYQTGTGVVEGDTPSSWYAGMGITVSLGRLAWALGARGPNPSMGWSLVWDEESVLKSIIPDPEYAIMLDFSKSWDEKYHFKLVTYATRCQADYNCRGVVIKASDGHVGWAWAGEWSRIITRLRASGRKVLVYGYSMSNSMYAIACAADRIILYPGGSISLKGLSMTKLYFAEGFSKLGVKAQFARFSQFKSAPEAFTNLSPSKEDMATMSSILKMVERQFRIMLLKRKGMGHKKIVDLFLKGSINPVEAIKLGLIDGMRYPDQMDMESARMLKTRVPLFDPSGIKQEATLPGTRGVAVLLLEGEIVIKSSMTNFLTGSSKQLVLKKVSKALSQAMGDPRIRAVVLRINSPGGSALASDVLWRTISKMNYAKPVIVSFGNYATSGGYYLGCPGRKILAESATITGSIGIFGGKFSVGDLLRKAGVGVTTIKRSPHADMSSIYRPYTDEEMLQLKSSLKYSYFRFLAAVAKGRSLPLNSMEKLAGGRLWTGEQAKKRKLVDGIGGLSEAIAMAKKMAKLSSKSPVYLVYPAPPSLLRQLITKNLGIPLPSTESKAALKPLGISVPASLLGPGPWARTPYTLTIK
ncbi:signal peptide peptidase SppA, partial [Myxococcota bacterium]|nr:signal peptide peptidase SppA [Myxococcota bacterium]